MDSIRTVDQYHQTYNNALNERDISIHLNPEVIEEIKLGAKC